MNTTTHSTSRTDRAGFGTRTGRFLALILTIGIAAPHALADDTAPASVAPGGPSAPQAADPDPALELSPYELAQLIRIRLAAYAVAPKATVDETAVRSAWRVAFKARIGRMLSRMTTVADDKRWDVRAPSVDGFTPSAESTPRILRELAGLYVELTAAEARIAKARIVRQPRTVFGPMHGRKKRQPTKEIQIVGVRSRENSILDRLGGLDRTDLLPGRGGIVELRPAREEGEILERADGPTLAERLRRPAVRHVRIRIWDREVEQRMKDAQQARIDAQVARIRADIDAYAHALQQDKDLVRALTASIQLAEEMRLRDEVATLADDGTRREALTLLDQMKLGRMNARALAFNKASDYGRALRRSWTQKRAALERLLATA